MGVGTIHIDFVSERKLDPVLLPDSLLYLTVGLWFLIEELVARKSNYLKAVLFIHLIQLNQRLVVLLSERSE